MYLSHFHLKQFFSPVVTDPASVATFASEVTMRFGAPDLLLNNAATITRSAPLRDVPAGDFPGGST